MRETEGVIPYNSNVRLISQTETERDIYSRKEVNVNIFEDKYKGIFPGTKTVCKI